MTQMRKGIAAQMTRALQVPHAYVHMEVDATNLVRARERAKKDYQAREGISLSYVPFVIKAAVEALRRQPAFNAHWTEQGLLAKRRIHMGVAVAVDDGLLVPVVRDVDQLSISGLNRAIADVAARARAGKLKLDDYGGSTFTIDNTGWFGSNLTMPIINVPEVAILTMEAITKRAGRQRDAGRRRHRHPPGHEHGPGHRPSGQRRRPGRRVPAGRSSPGSRASGRRRLSTESRRRRDRGAPTRRSGPAGAAVRGRTSTSGPPGAPPSRRRGARPLRLAAAPPAGGPRAARSSPPPALVRRSTSTRRPARSSSVALVVVAIWLVRHRRDRLAPRGSRSTRGSVRTRRVQSGLRLAGCPDIAFREDVYFPSWVRFEGKRLPLGGQPAADRPEQRRTLVRGDRLPRTATCGCTGSTTTRRAAPATRSWSARASRRPARSTSSPDCG